MRNRIVFMLLLIVLSVVACSEKRNVVRDFLPVSPELEGIAPVVDDMARMDPSERGAYLEKNWPHLSEDVVYYLRRLGKLNEDQRVERCIFNYGSLEKIIEAESGNGRQRGLLQDQLVALVKVDGISEPLAVIVECLNSTFILPEQLNMLQKVGDHTPQERFTIGPREGLVHYVDYPVAMDLAERFGLPLYKGRKIEEQFRITPSEARRLEATTDSLQVTVYVVEGDRFDLVAMTYQPSPRRHN